MTEKQTLSGQRLKPVYLIQREESTPFPGEWDYVFSYLPPTDGRIWRKVFRKDPQKGGECLD